MLTKDIPTPTGVPNYTQRVQLDGRTFSFRFSWNDREERWYLAILDESDEPLVAGVKLVTNWPLLRAYQSDPRVPQGSLQVVTRNSDTSPPGFYDFGLGKRCELTYFTNG